MNGNIQSNSPIRLKVKTYLLQIFSFSFVLVGLCGQTPDKSSGLAPLALSGLNLSKWVLSVTPEDGELVYAAKRKEYYAAVFATDESFAIMMEPTEFKYVVRDAVTTIVDTENEADILDGLQSRDLIRKYSVKSRKGIVDFGDHYIVDKEKRAKLPRCITIKKDMTDRNGHSFSFVADVVR